MRRGKNNTQKVKKKILRQKKQANDKNSFDCGSRFFVVMWLRILFEQEKKKTRVPYMCSGRGVFLTRLVVMGCLFPCSLTMKSIKLLKLQRLKWAWVDRHNIPVYQRANVCATLSRSWVSYKHLQNAGPCDSPAKFFCGLRPIPSGAHTVSNPYCYSAETWP